MKSEREDLNDDIKVGDAKPIDEEDIETLSGSKKNVDVHKIYLPQCAAYIIKGNYLKMKYQFYAKAWMS